MSRERDEPSKRTEERETTRHDDARRRYDASNKSRNPMITA
jgi:hypothetical protein